MWIWGGGDIEIIWPDGADKHLYYRPHYGTLYENFNNAPISDLDYWLQYGRARGEPKP